MTGEQLRSLQLAELELLKETDRICRKAGIRYNIIAGTLLGAVRHKGFIPWDDDVDVAMFREEYGRFVKACERYLDTSRFEFQDHRVTEGYRWGYGKLRLKGTLFLREHQEHMPYFQGICMDVFPLDYVPEARLLRALKNLECFIVRKLLWARVGKRADKRSFFRLWYSLLDKIPENQVKGLLDRMIRSAGRKKTSWVRILMFPTPNREYGYRACWYEKSREYFFEGTAFPGIRDYEKYLTFKFGNWRKPPPESGRKVHPVSCLVLPGNEKRDDDK